MIECEFNNIIAISDYVLSYMSKKEFRVGIRIVNHGQMNEVITDQVKNAIRKSNLGLIDPDITTYSDGGNYDIVITNNGGVPDNNVTKIFYLSFDNNQKILYTDQLLNDMRSYFTSLLGSNSKQ